MEPPDPYQGREASEVKHLVLRGYLQKLAYKVGMWCRTLHYVEGFAGPWNAHTEDLSDTSPHIAIAELRAAADGLRKANRQPPRMRCLFVEADKQAAETLRESMRAYSDIEVQVLQGKLLERIPDVVAFVQSRATPSPRFTFIFVDPTGWTGYDPEVIAPLLAVDHTEVLINFMTKDVIRFIDDRREEIRRSFNPLFGSEEARREWQGLQGREREDAIVGAFSRRLREIGGFRHVVTAIVLHPTKDRTHFHLVYATRSDEGLRTFRGVERSALAAQRMIREAARRDARIRRTGQGELFAPGDVEAESYVDQLRARHHAMARETVFALLETRRAVPYDELEVAALLHPMTSTKDVKGWLKDWKDQGWVAYEGLAPREQVPKPGKGHRVLWLRMPSGGREGGGAR